jgi:hypothetical protein
LQNQQNLSRDGFLLKLFIVTAYLMQESNNILSWLHTNETTLVVKLLQHHS